jgi:hypothetical protein
MDFTQCDLSITYANAVGKHEGGDRREPVTAFNGEGGV